MTKKQSLPLQSKMAGGSRTRKARSGRVDPPQTQDLLSMLHAVGLFRYVWPKGRILQGVRVCKWMKGELSTGYDIGLSFPVVQKLAQVELQVALPHGAESLGQESAGLLRLLEPARAELSNAVARTVQRFSRNRMSLRFDEEMDDWISQPIGMAVADGVLQGCLGCHMPAQLQLFLCDGVPTQRLAEIVTTCKGSLTHLGFTCSSTEAASSEVDALCTALTECPTLRHLELSFRVDAVEGAESEQLVKVVEGCASLSSLTLLDCRVDDHHEQLVRAFQQCTNLKHLGLGDALPWDHLHAAIAHCTELTHLDLRHNQSGPSAGVVVASVVERCTNLAHLDMAHTQINTEGASALAMALPCCALNYLDLSNCDLGNRSLSALSTALPRMTALRKLKLGCRHFSQQSLRALAAALTELTMLSTLKLSGRRLGDDGVRELAPALRGMRSLKQLGLIKTGFGQGGAQHLSGVLRETTALTELRLPHNGVGDEGLRRMAEVLECCSVVSLDVRGNRLTEDGVVELVRLLTRCAGLKSVQVGVVSRAGVERIAEEIARCGSEMDVLYSVCPQELLLERVEAMVARGAGT